jgi:co-chaperonin GroES (HSP10)
MKNLIPRGNMVLLKFEVTGTSDLFKKKASLYVPNGDSAAAPGNSGKPKYRAKIAAVGDAVDSSKVEWKVGDLVIYNDYDCKTFGSNDGDEVWGLIKSESIWATYEE